MGRKDTARAPTDIRRNECKAFSTKCATCNKVGHYTKFCKEKTEEKVKSNNIMIMCGVGNMEVLNATMTHRQKKRMQ